MISMNVDLNTEESSKLNAIMEKRGMKSKVETIRKLIVEYLMNYN
jgi:metal-responsive CopG/Arc/MetJ family transcriptional regulator